MLSSPITVPIWIFATLAILSVLFLIDRIFVPSVRWVIRRKVNRVITEINEHLKFEIRPFQLTKRKVLIDRLVYDPIVVEAIEAHCQQTGMPHEVAMDEVRGYAKEIVPAFNAYVYYRWIYQLCRYVCRLFYRVRVGVADEDEIRNIDRKATVVFVMNHRSNFDYLLVAYLASKQTTLSYAAGEWAKIFLLQSVIRAMGAFFVRRDSGNPLYRSVLERYVHMATREGVCQAVFPEGGLTKTGSIAPPKLGFIDYMLRGFDVDKDRDVIFLPVGINYDKVVEDQVQIDAGHGIRFNRSIWNLTKTAVKFLFANFTKRRNRRRDLFGYASVNFGHTISTKEFADRLGINFVALDKETRFNYTAMLAKKLMNGIGYVTPVLPVPLIAQVFRRSDAAFLSELDVISAVHNLIDEMIALGAPLHDSEKPAKKTMQKSLTLMVHYGLLEPVDDGFVVAADSQDLLDYYANSIEHWFGGVEYIDPLQHRVGLAATVKAAQAE